MGLFNRNKKKRGTTLTDEDREAASERRKQLAELRSLKFAREKIEQQIELAQAKQELMDVIGEEEDDNLFGLDKDTMNLINILTKGKANSMLNPLQQPIIIPQTAESPSGDTSSELDHKAKLLAEGLPAPLKKQLKELDPLVVKRAVDLL